MTQTDLFERARRVTRRSDPKTSLEAAVRLVASGGQGSQQARVLEALRRLGGWVAASEVAEACGLEPYVVRKRLPELARLGLVERVETDGRERVWSAW